MKRFLGWLMIFMSLLGFAPAHSLAAAKIPVIIASSFDTSEQNFNNLTFYKLKELAQKYSDNAFDFQLFPGMQLGDELETVRGIQLGTIQMAMLATNNYAPFAPSCGWLNMPYLFDSLEEFRGLVDAMWDQHNEWAIKESPHFVHYGYRLPPIDHQRQAPGPQACRRQGHKDPHSAESAHGVDL